MAEHVDPDVLKRIADLTDGEMWELADFLVEQFPSDEYGDAEHGTKTGLHAALDDAEEGLRREYGIEVKASQLRNVRATALAWPDAERSASAPFTVHQLIRGGNRQAEMTRYFKRNNGRPLTMRVVRRFRSEDKNKAPIPWDVMALKRITSTVRSLLLGGIVTKREDWWEAAGPKDRAAVAAMLQDLATKVRP